MDDLHLSGASPEAMHHLEWVVHRALVGLRITLRYVRANDQPLLALHHHQGCSQTINSQDDLVVYPRVSSHLLTCLTSISMPQSYVLELPGRRSQQCRLAIRADERLSLDRHVQGWELDKEWMLNDKRCEKV